MQTRGPAITIESKISAVRAKQPRAEGAARVSARRGAGGSRIGDLRMSGALKLLFPQSRGVLQAMLVNSAGGITGGDRFRLEAEAEAGAALSLTTQAAERAYRAQPGECADVSVRLKAGAGAVLHWLPQETILFQACALRRRLRVELEGDARLLLCEPLVFGRTAMGEKLTDGWLSDRVELFRDGQRAFTDATRLEGDISAQLAGPATGAGCRASALVVYVGADAEHQRDALRDALPEDALAGASLIAEDMMVARFLGPDGFGLRRLLMPALDRLSGNTLPRSWRL
ncbi:urease accessory protein UreD [Oceanicola sp. D3]|uniref:urease accessory protein UreD n=1 Tax=Oceanicola sp. D3 TaxID=2587163 RepID=UPI0011213883|nr:urease accessory protein UreD [Oceanicola sp. D3]QDC08861.1 urease accessory protein UreD [Oceanicola sp. D3]